MILNRIVIFLFLTLPCLGVVCQITVTPSNGNACNCSGTMSYVSAMPFNSDYILSDYSGSIVSAGSSANGNINITGLCPEVYTIEVTQSGTTTSLPFNISTLNIDPGDAEDVTVCSTDPNVNLNNTIIGIAAGGSWTDPNSQMIPNILSANSMMDGWYLYTIPSGGCNVVTGVFVDFIQNANPGSSTTYLICEDYLPFSMVNFLAGVPDLNGAWFNAQAAPMNGIFDPATMNSGLFTYMIDTVAGCGPVFSTLFVDENQNPDAGENATILVCANGTNFNMLNYLGGNPQAGGQWFSPTNAPVNGTFNPATYAEGNYRYHLNGLTPCVDDNAFLTVTFVIDNPSGSNASITVCETSNSINMLNALNGNPLAGGTWNDEQGLPVDNTFNPQIEPPGNYFYYYPNVGCAPQNVELSIIIENLPNAGNDNALSVCENVASLNLNGLLGVGADIGGTWSDANGVPTAANFIPPSSGNNFIFNYHVDGAICPDDNAQLTVSLESAPANPPPASITLCSEDAVFDLHTLYPQFPQLQFENQNGTVVGDLFDPSISGSITLLAIESSQNSCPDGSGNVSIQVIQPLFPVDYISLDLCESLNTFNLQSLDENAIPANGNWTDVNDLVIPPTVSISGNAVDQYTFIGTVNTGCGNSVLTVEIHSYTSTEAGPNNSVVYCNSDNSQTLLELMPSTGLGNGTWSVNGQPFLSTVIDPSVNSSGSYIYTVQANGPCPADASELLVTIEQGIFYNAGEDIEVCAGSAPIQVGELPDPNFNYIWSPANYLSNENSAFPFILIPAETNGATTINYTVSITDGICETEDELQLTIYPNPTVNIGDVEQVCFGENVEILTALIGNYIWSPSNLFNDNNLQNQNFIPLEDVLVSLAFTDNNGCSGSDDVQITVHPNPTLIFDPSPIASCAPLTVYYFTDGTSQNVDYLEWNIPGIGTFYADTLNTSIDASGQYNLEVTAFSDFGCESSLQYNYLMEVYESPVADFSSDPIELTTINPIAQFLNESFAAVTSEWNFSNLGYSSEDSPVFEFPNSNPANFDICLKVISENGCVDSTCRILHLDNEYIFYAPNAITPDNDGINDVFSPLMKGFDESTYSLEIFDRWGDLIFITKEYGKPWTGNVRNGEHYVQDDAYVWQVKVKDKEKAEYKVFQGTLIVVR